MEYISAEEFLKLSDGVQDVFMNWWQPELFDLAFHIERTELNEPTMISRIFNDGNLIIIGEYLHIATFKDNLIPLLTEGQLRKFIEDKTGGKIQFTITPIVHDYAWRLHDEFEWYHTGKTEVLEAYWKIACDIASEEVTNEI